MDFFLHIHCDAVDLVLLQHKHRNGGGNALDRRKLGADKVRHFTHCSCVQADQKLRGSAHQIQTGDFRETRNALRNLVIAGIAFRLGADADICIDMFNIGLVPVDDRMIAADDLVLLKFFFFFFYVFFAFAENIRKIGDRYTRICRKQILIK